MGIIAWLLAIFSKILCISVSRCCHVYDGLPCDARCSFHYLVQPFYDALQSYDWRSAYDLLVIFLFIAAVYIVLAVYRYLFAEFSWVAVAALVDRAINWTLAAASQLLLSRRFQWWDR